MSERFGLDGPEINKGKKRILIVEDEVIVAKDLARRLEKMGYSIASLVVSGEDAIEKAESEKPDLILMDIMLAGEIDGITAANRIRSFYSGPIIYLTAYGNEEMLVRAKTTGPHGYIIKPYEAQELHIAIDIALYKHGMELELEASRDELELRVQERTSSLKEAETKLIAHATQLEENNAALKVLLRQREKDKKEYENNILSNIKQLILPYIEKLKRNMPVSDELTYLKIIETNLMEIVSPFAYKLSSKYLGFTPKELQIANLIKDGKQDKDIIEIMNISLDTVKVHRKNIRRKLGISGEKINLRTKLLTLE